MKTAMCRNGASRRGVALVYAVFGSFVAASLVSVMFAMAGVTNDRAALERARVQARYLAEGATDSVRKTIQTALANFGDPTDTGTVMVDGTPVQYTVAEVGVPATVTEASGIRRLVAGYEISATAVVNGFRERAHRIVETESTPIFQFAVFYDNDLEILPGPNMTLSGRVHSNGSMYLGCNGTLTMDTNYVRAVGDIYRRRKDTDASNGTVDIRKWVPNPYDGSMPSEFQTMYSRSQLEGLGISSASGYDADFGGYDHFGDGDYLDPEDWLPWAPGALEYWGAATGITEEGYTVLSGAHGTQEAAPPDLGSIVAYEESPSGVGDWRWDGNAYVYDPGNGTHEPGFFHQSADLSILVSADGTVNAYDASGGVIALPLGAVQVRTIYDARQAEGSGESTQVLWVDVAALSGIFPANGLLYASHLGLGEGTAAAGIQLSNGAELPGDLTVVSEGSIYLDGDYNVTNKKSAAVIGDAINLLSNAWDGTKAPGDVPDASETTYNVALITGNVPTTDGGAYSGGFENLPRFHEDWGGVNCNIQGSFVNLWESRYATSPWGQSGVYSAPRRNWDYDPMFNDVASLPPFTPMVVDANDVVTW